jgi:hypothetical protein
LKRLFAVFFLGGVSFGCAPRATTSPAVESAASASTTSDYRFFSERCRFRTRKDGSATQIACNDEELLLILPGIGWRAGSPSGRQQLLAERDAWTVSVLSADPSESSYDVAVHLEAVYRGIADSLPPGLRASAPHFEQMPQGHLVLSYELKGTLEGRDLQQTNAWTAQRRKNGQYVDYHVSYTDAEVAQNARAVKEAADLFFVTDGAGTAPPQ